MPWPGGVCRRGVWLWQRLLGFRFLLSAGGGLYLAAAPTSPASLTTSSKAADVAATLTTKMGLICTPWGAKKVILPAWGVWPGPVACVGRVPG